MAEPGIPSVNAGRIAEEEKIPSHPEEGSQLRFTEKVKLIMGL